MAVRSERASRARGARGVRGAGRVRATARLLLERLDDLLDGGDVLEAELLGDDLEVAHRVDLALDVRRHVAVRRLLEDADDVEDRVRRRNVREEGVAEALARRRALDQAGDVHHLQERRHLRLGLPIRDEILEPIVGHLDPRLCRVDGAKLPRHTHALSRAPRRACEAAASGCAPGSSQRARSCCTSG